MATSAKKAQDLAEALLGIGSSGADYGGTVDEVMANAVIAAHKKTGGIDMSTVQNFYTTNKKPVLIGAAVAVTALVGIMGYSWYKKWHAAEDKDA